MWRCSALVLLALLVSCERYPTGGDLRIRRDMVNQASFRAQEDPRIKGIVPWAPLEYGERSRQRQPYGGQPSHAVRGQPHPRDLLRMAVL